MKKLFITILLASCGAAGPQTPKEAIKEKTEVYCEPVSQDVYYCMREDYTHYWCVYKEMKWECRGVNR